MSCNYIYNCLAIDILQVFSSDRLEIKEEEDGGSVIVKEARLNDSGNIKCVATNVLGRATSVAQLTIEGRIVFVSLYLI